jgi:hypothetical protein
MEFFSKRSVVRNVRPETVLPSLIVILSCPIENDGTFVKVGLVSIQGSQNVEKFCQIVIKLKLVRRFTVYKTHYKAVRIDSLFILGPGKRERKV